MIDDGIACDLKNPRYHAVRVLKATDMLMNTQKDLLQQIIRVCRIVRAFGYEGSETIMELFPYSGRGVFHFISSR